MIADCIKWFDIVPSFAGCHFIQAITYLRQLKVVVNRLQIFFPCIQMLEKAHFLLIHALLCTISIIHAV